MSFVNDTDLDEISELLIWVLENRKNRTFEIELSIRIENLSVLLDEKHAAILRQYIKKENSNDTI